MTHTITSGQMYAQVRDTLGREVQDQYVISEIVTHLIEMFGCVDIETIDYHLYWRIVESHVKECWQ